MILIESLPEPALAHTTPNYDYLHIEWYEASKRILRRQTEKGLELGIRLGKQSAGLEHGRILWQDAETTILLDILPCESIVLHPQNMTEMGALCYEIGNRHLPLFLQNNSLLIPYENPTFDFLQKLGYQPIKAMERLTNLLKTTVQTTPILGINQPLIDADTEIIIS